MEHEMILMDADFNPVVRMTARRRAGVAQVGERNFRTVEVGASIASTGSNINAGGQYGLQGDGRSESG